MITNFIIQNTVQANRYYCPPQMNLKSLQFCTSDISQYDGTKIQKLNHLIFI